MTDPYNALSSRIRSGAYLEGSRLVPERQLAGLFRAFGEACLLMK